MTALVDFACSILTGDETVCRVGCKRDFEKKCLLVHELINYDELSGLEAYFLVCAERLLLCRLVSFHVVYSSECLERIESLFYTVECV